MRLDDDFVLGLLHFVPLILSHGDFSIFLMKQQFHEIDLELRYVCLRSRREWVVSLIGISDLEDI